MLNRDEVKASPIPLLGVSFVGFVFILLSLGFDPRADGIMELCSRC